MIMKQVWNLHQSPEMPVLQNAINAQWRVPPRRERKKKKTSMQKETKEAQF